MGMEAAEGRGEGFGLGEGVPAKHAIEPPRQSEHRIAVSPQLSAAQSGHALEVHLVWSDDVCDAVWCGVV